MVLSGHYIFFCCVPDMRPSEDVEEPELEFEKGLARENCRNSLGTRWACEGSVRGWRMGSASEKSRTPKWPPLPLLAITSRMKPDSISHGDSGATTRTLR